MTSHADESKSNDKLHSDTSSDLANQQSSQCRKKSREKPDNRAFAIVFSAVKPYGPRNQRRIVFLFGVNQIAN